MNHPSKSRRILKALLICSLLTLLAPLSLAAKTTVDFDPGMDFSKFKTFAFIGGVERMVMLPVNPDLINNRLHRAVARELTRKGLREVQPGENPDLVIRYWANSSQQLNVATLGNWGAYGPYVGSYWAWHYDNVSAADVREGSLLVDLIDANAKALAWRLYLVRKLTNADKDWKKVDDDFAGAFESFPPSEKEREAKRRERAEHPPKPGQS
jgi:hypothetical protein